MTGQAPRAAAIQRAFLSWLHRQAEVHPQSQTFLMDPTAVVDEEQVTDAELSDALEILDAHGLISDVGSLAGRLFRVGITKTGRLCLIAYDGDVRAWRTASGPANVTVNASGNLQAAVNSANVMQIMHAVQSGIGPVDRAKYARAASTLLSDLDDLGLPDEVAADLRQAAGEIQAETAQSEPDDGKLRRAGAVIVKGLGAVTTSALGGTAARYIVELLALAS